jgi:hypothetical protein
MTYLDVDFDAHMAEEAVTQGHRVKLKFDDGVSAKLIHPDDGSCKPSTQCGRCAADLKDPESTRCYDCKNMAVDDCWLTGWFDNCGIDELLTGSVELPVAATWEGDHPRVEIVPDTPASPVLGDEERERLRKVADGMERHQENAEANGAIGAGAAAQYASEVKFLRKLAQGEERDA